MKDDGFYHCPKDNSDFHKDCVENKQKLSFTYQRDAREAYDKLENTQAKILFHKGKVIKEDGSYE